MEKSIYYRIERWLWSYGGSGWSPWSIYYRIERSVYCLSLALGDSRLKICYRIESHDLPLINTIAITPMKICYRIERDLHDILDDPRK